MLLHTAVVAYPTHTYRVSTKWAEALAQEFLSQVGIKRKKKKKKKKICVMKPSVENRSEEDQD